MRRSDELLIMREQMCLSGRKCIINSTLSLLSHRSIIALASSISEAASAKEASLRSDGIIVAHHSREGKQEQKYLLNVHSGSRTKEKGERRSSDEKPC